MRILCVYAHPDYEAFGPSAILAKYARRGARIHAVYFTRGEHGNTSVEPKPGPDELAAQARDHGEPDSAQHGHEPPDHPRGPPTRRAWSGNRRERESQT